MALGELTRQIAQQALGNQMKEVLEGGGKSGAPAPPEGLAAVLIGQVQAMQRALKEDEELVVELRAGTDAVRVVEFFMPSQQVLVATGTDASRNVVRVVAAAAAVQLVCRPVKVQAGSKPHRIGFLAPKPKPE